MSQKQENIDFSDFLKLDIRMGKVIEAEAMEESDKLISTVVDFGSEVGKRTIVSGIREWYEPEDLVGKLFPFVINLEPKKIMGIESQGMLLAAGPINEAGEKTTVLLTPLSDTEPGTKVV